MCWCVLQAVLAPFLLFCVCILEFHHAEATPDTLSSLDSSFCQWVSQSTSLPATGIRSINMAKIAASLHRPLGAVPLHLFLMGHIGSFAGTDCLCLMGLASSLCEWVSWWVLFLYLCKTSGGLEVIYPGLDIDKCLLIPKDLREKVSTVWKAPSVYFSRAQKVRAACVSAHQFQFHHCRLLNKCFTHLLSQAEENHHKIQIFLLL